MGAGKTTVGRERGRSASAAGWSTPTSSSRPAPVARSARSSRPTARRRSARSRPRRSSRRSTTPSRSSSPPPAGVLMRPENRDALRRSGAQVVWLRADPAVLVERATRGEHRPLLDGDPDAAMRRMLPTREPLYREVADVVIDTDRLADGRRRRPGDRARRRRSAGSRCRSATAPTTSSSATAPSRSLAGLLPATAARAAVVTQATVPFAVDLRWRRRRLEIGDGEPAKTLATIEMLHAGFAQLGLTRHDVVIGVGGGMVTDVAGFAAVGVAPRRAGRARGHDAARHGRRRDRRQDRRQPARGQEPRRRVLAAGGRRVRPRRAGHAAGPRAALRATARWPSTTS